MVRAVSPPLARSPPRDWAPFRLLRPEILITMAILTSQLPMTARWLFSSMMALALLQLGRQPLFLSITTAWERPFPLFPLDLPDHRIALAWLISTATERWMWFFQPTLPAPLSFSWETDWDTSSKVPRSPLVLPLILATLPSVISTMTGGLMR